MAGWPRSGLAAILLAAAVLVASPGTREAVARRLGLRGIGVQIGGPPPPTVTTTPGARLDLGLGDRVTLEEARRRVDFPVVVPSGLGRPDAVFVNEAVPPGGGSTSSTGPGRPARLALHRRRAADHPVPGPADRRVPQEGHRHGHGRGGHGRRRARLLVQRRAPFFTYIDAAGGFREEQTRLAGNTLIWQRGDLTLRLEGDIPKEEAIRIAESMR